MQYRSRCNSFNSIGNTLLFMYIYKRRVVNISENIVFLFYKEIKTKYLILYYNICNMLHICYRHIMHTINSEYMNIFCLNLNTLKQR